MIWPDGIGLGCWVWVTQSSCQVIPPRKGGNVLIVSYKRVKTHRRCNEMIVVVVVEGLFCLNKYHCSRPRTSKSNFRPGKRSIFCVFTKKVALFLEKRKTRQNESNGCWTLGRCFPCFLASYLRELSVGIALLSEKRAPARVWVGIGARGGGS